MKLGVLVSGALGLNLLKHLTLDYDIIFVMTDSNSQAIIEFCEEKEFSVFLGNPRKGRSENFLKDKKIDILISVNYLFVIEENLIKLPNLLAFNIHGSLLPKYRGRTPHVWAIINNEKQTGITAHVIDKGCDTGPVIDQIKISIEEDDTGASILDKFQKLYVTLVDSVLEKIAMNDIELIPQDNSKATIFGKRTPDDGKIEWNWHKERIYNWVRAQSFPYPGAFSFYEKEKVIIDEIEITEDGYNFEMTNGLIVSSEPLKIKCPNGVILIKNIRDKNLDFQTGKILN